MSLLKYGSLLKGPTRPIDYTTSTHSPRRSKLTERKRLDTIRKVWSKKLLEPKLMLHAMRFGSLEKV